MPLQLHQIQHLQNPQTHPRLKIPLEDLVLRILTLSLRSLQVHATLFALVALFELGNLPNLRSHHFASLNLN